MLKKLRLPQQLEILNSNMEQLSREITVDLNEVKEFIESEEFVQFLLNNSVNIEVPAFILQVLLNKIEELKREGTE